MLSALQQFFRSADAAHPGVGVNDELITAETITKAESKLPAEVVDQAVNQQVPDEAAQSGVTQAEAITLSWTKTSLGAAYILMFLIYFVNAFQSSITNNLSAYVTSGFESHSLIPVIYIVSNVMSAATYMPVAKILNLWDRSIGFLLMATFATIGLVLSATCNDIATYCASQIAYYCWADYFTSYLQVVYGTSIEVAGYISSIFDVVSGVWLLFVGLLIKKTGRFRWLLWISVPLYILGVGLMIYFRNPSWSVGYTIMCQVFIAFAGGTMIICQQVAVLAASDHNHAASSLAFLNCFGSMGSAIGSSISGAIWTHTLPAALKRLLPDSAKADWETIYDSLESQLSYPSGEAVRHAISLAYAEAQSRMLIAGTAIMALSLIWMFVIRDIKLTKEVQTKGVLF
ncbi:hypothetical protein Plec18170_005092 [Paecilomyces lecythidis]